jgi:hypothetical protein
VSSSTPRVVREARGGGIQACEVAAASRRAWWGWRWRPVVRPGDDGGVQVTEALGGLDVGWSRGDAE